MKFILVGVSRGAVLVRGYEDVKKLRDGAKELVDICRQVLITKGDDVIYEFDREKQKARNETKNVIMEKIEAEFPYRVLTAREKRAMEMVRYKVI